MAKRLVLNLSVATAYYSLFHIGLWRLGWGKRKYLADVYPTAGNMRHNLFYWSLGILQWTLWDCVMIRLWATGKVPYTSNAELLSSWRSLVLNVFAVFMTPCWRDTHFYIVHRFSHLRAVYKFVHSLHHVPTRNHGLCMHPIEHCTTQTPGRRRSIDALAFHLPLHFRPPNAPVRGIPASRTTSSRTSTISTPPKVRV